MVVDVLRMKVYRSWGQISVKDFDRSTHYSEIGEYAKSTWSDINKIVVNVVRIKPIAKF